MPFCCPCLGVLFLVLTPNPVEIPMCIQLEFQVFQLCEYFSFTLNPNRHDTWSDTRQQPVPACTPASRVNKKAAAKRIYQCMYTVQQLECLYISCQWNVCSHLYTEHKLHKPCMHRFVLYHYVHVYMPVIHNVNYLYIHVQTRQNNIHTSFLV